MPALTFQPGPGPLMTFHETPPSGTVVSVTSVSRAAGYELCSFQTDLVTRGPNPFAESSFPFAAVI